MPRGRSSGRSSGGGSSLFSSRPSRPTASAPPPRTPAPAAAPAPPPAPMRGGGSATGGLGSTIVEGMAFGGGSAIAHRAVDAVVGPRVIRHETVTSTGPAPESATLASSNSLGDPDTCGFHFKAFQDCLNTSGSDISKCQLYMDMLSECRKTSVAGLSA